MIELINRFFVPVHLRNGDFADDGNASSKAKAERNRVYREALDQGLSAGSVCIYLLSPDARPMATAPLNQSLATDPGRLAELMEQVIAQLELKGGDPLIPPAPRTPPECKPRSVVLDLTARYLERRGADLVPLDTASILGTDKGGNWGDLPSRDWIVFDEADWKRLLPPHVSRGDQIALDDSWDLDSGVVAGILTHFYPPTENTDLRKNHLEEHSLQARVESISGTKVRARIEGRLRMKHPFYHKDDDYYVEATVIGYLEFSPADSTIDRFGLVTDEATYGSRSGTKQPFGAAVRLLNSPPLTRGG